MERGTDPGARNEQLVVPMRSAGTAVADDVAEDNVPVAIARYAADSIVSRVTELYSGHKMESLVAEILTADGFVCPEHGQGADDGIDIVAGGERDPSVWTAHGSLFRSRVRHLP